MPNDFISVKLTFFESAKKLMAGPERFNAALRREMGKAGRISGLKIKALMRRKIREGVPPSNAQMTVDLKGSSKPLVDSGRLFKAITSESGGGVNDFEIRVGVKLSNKLANVAKIVHDGYKQTVTRKQEVMFKMLHLASVGRKVNLRSERARQILARAKGVIAPLKEGQVIVAPPRPFALRTLSDPATKKLVEHEFREALKRTFQSLG